MFSESFLLFRFLLCSRCFDVRGLRLSVVPLTHLNIFYLRPPPTSPTSPPDLPTKDIHTLNTPGGGIYWEETGRVTLIKYPLLPTFSGVPFTPNLFFFYFLLFLLVFVMNFCGY